MRRRCRILQQQRGDRGHEDAHALDSERAHERSRGHAGLRAAAEKPASARGYQSRELFLAVLGHDLRELNVNMNITPWMGLYGPARMPPDIVNRINQALRASAAAADVKEWFARQGFEVGISSDGELEPIQRNQFEVFRKAAQVDGVKFD